MSYLLKDLPSHKALEVVTSRFSQIDVAYFEAMIRLLKLGADLNDATEKFFAANGLSDGRFSILTNLYLSGEKGSINQTELSKRMRVTRASMTSFIDGLEKDGLIERTSDPGDRRVHVIKLTEKGRQKIEPLVPLHFKHMGEFMQVLSPREIKELEVILDKLMANLQVFED